MREKRFLHIISILSQVQSSLTILGGGRRERGRGEGGEEREEGRREEGLRRSLQVCGLHLVLKVAIGMVKTQQSDHLSMMPGSCHVESSGASLGGERGGGGRGGGVEEGEEWEERERKWSEGCAGGGREV